MAQRHRSSLDVFFKRKDPPPSTASKVVSNGVIDLAASPPSKKQKTVHRGLEAKEPMTQTTSAYFSKPKSSISPLSRPVLQDLQAFRLPRLPPLQASQSGSAFDTHSFGLSASYVPDSQPENEPSQRTAEQERKHEEWQARMLAMGRMFKRRRSLALDEAAIAEAKKAAGIDTPDDEVTPFDDGAQEDEATLQKAEETRKKLQRYASKDAEKSTVKGKSKGKRKEEVGPSGMIYTPLEKQYMEIKDKNKDVLLMMEVGYKYKFHGDDAKIVAQELGIVAFPNRNFFTASIPTHRLHIHVKKLVSLGYKVGVITQTETAALKKASDNKNAPFTRKLTHLYTAATYVDDTSYNYGPIRFNDSFLPGSAPPPTNALLVVVEESAQESNFEEKVRIGLVSVIPEIGEVMWDEFEDSQVRSELETRLTHLCPAELILPKDNFSKPTEKVLKHFAEGPKAKGENAVRVERIEGTLSYNAAFDYLIDFYQEKGDQPSRTAGFKSDCGSDAGDSSTQNRDKEKNDGLGLAAGTEGEHLINKRQISSTEYVKDGEVILSLLDFPKQIVIALTIAVRHMKRFGLENAFKHKPSFVKFANRSHMLLSSNTLANLEIYRNQTDRGLYGSLMWLLDHCKTRMGKRLLREWIGRPLIDVVALRARADAIEEIMENNSYHMEKLRSLLVNMPDLVKGLTRIQYGKVTPTELASILVSLVRLASEFNPNTGDCFQSALLNRIPNTLPTILSTAQIFLNALNLKAARNNDEGNLWTDLDKYPDIQDVKDASCINVCEMELDDHLQEVRKIIRRPALQYITVSGIEYLVEVPVRETKTIPPQWVKVSSTKTVNRYHTPEIIKKLREREQHKEKLAGVARKAFLAFQADVAECHELVSVSKQVAVIDCLMSLAQVAAAGGYCKPKFVAEAELHIRAGRHPMVEMLREKAYVPFDIDFSETDGIAKVITGPNMAGELSLCFYDALIVCLAQIGSFVPASSVILGVHDAIQTRMGASDDIGRGKSTFMVELSETSDILRTVTPRSLVIMDELGRGTSTHDGVAIAYATLSHIASVGCNTLFVTHYPIVAEELAREKPQQISNWHMSFEEVKLPGDVEITFMYQLKRELAEASFGVWCARLAGLPEAVLKTAQDRSDALKVETQRRLRNALIKRTEQVFYDIADEKVKFGEIVRNAEILHKALTTQSTA
nr:DNA mismatch repair protein MSH3 [Cryptococcus depauperatus CBS 7855]